MRVQLKEGGKDRLHRVPLSESTTVGHELEDQTGQLPKSGGAEGDEPRVPLSRGCCPSQRGREGGARCTAGVLGGDPTPGARVHFLISLFLSFLHLVFTVFFLFVFF